MKKTFILITMIISLCTCPILAEASCSGSGTVWSCTSGSTVANVNSAIASSTTGATITLASGAYTWNVTSLLYDPLKSTTVICSSVGACDVTLGTNRLLYHDDVNGATNPATQSTWRLSGFDFVAGACGVPCIWAAPRSAQPIQYLTVRLDHNTFNGQGNSTDFMYFGEISRPMYVTGVIDHNSWTNSTQTRVLVLYGTGDPTAFPSTLLGSGNCLFFEDNNIDFTAPDNNGAALIDAENASCYVARFNSLKNARVGQHGVSHGWGTVNIEVYGNTFLRTTDSDFLGNCFRSIHIQGSGTGAFWGNTFSCFSAISTPIALLHYRDTTIANHGAGGSAEICDGTNAVDGNTAPEATHRGYPCKQQPGRAVAGGAPGWGTLSPMATFRNTNLADGSRQDMVFGCGWAAPEYCAAHVQSNRDYYNAVSVNEQTTSSSPFNGTTGIGHGTLANRPTTCTHTTPPADDGGGVMYWATDQGAWNTSTSNPFGVNASGADGHIYRCSSTDTWTLFYTPYTYPHPLNVSEGGGGGGGGGDPPPPTFSGFRWSAGARPLAHAGQRPVR